MATTVVVVSVRTASTIQLVSIVSNVCQASSGHMVIQSHNWTCVHPVTVTPIIILENVRKAAVDVCVAQSLQDFIVTAVVLVTITTQTVYHVTVM